jgi:hypothetical protein
MGTQGSTIDHIQTQWKAGRSEPTLTLVIHDNNVLGKRAGHASELVRISPILPLIINYTTKLEDIGKKQVVLQTTELNTMSNFTTSTTPW